MDSKELTNLLLVIQAAITLLLALRAFVLYARTRNDTLFTLGVSMGMIALGGIAGLLGGVWLTAMNVNTLWFRYIGQTVSYLFILLSILPDSERYRRLLPRWHVFCSLLLFLLLTPLMPANPNVLTQAVLSGSRMVVCLVIAYNYVVFFFSKGSRFSLLMSLAFLLISVGITIYTLKFFVPNPLPLDALGDGMRILGLVTLFITFLVK